MLVRVVTLVVAVAVAAVGAGLVLLWAQGADQRARDTAGAGPAVVATAPIPAGTTVAQARASESLGVADVVLPETLEGTYDSVERVAELDDQVFAADMLPGEVFIEGKVREPSSLDDPLGLEPASTVAEPPAPEEPSPGRAAVTIELGEAQRGSAFLRAGSRVAVLVTVEPADDPVDDQTCVLLDAATVIAVGAESTTREGDEAAEEEVPGTFVTVEVDQERAARLVHGQAQGPLYLIQRPQAGGPDFTPGTCYGDDDLGLSPVGPPGGAPAAPDGAAEPAAPQAG